MLRRLKEEPATAGIPVAILSAEAAPAVIRHMRASGVIAYLTKPLDLTELGQLIDSFAAELEREAGPASRTATGTMNGVVLYIDDQPDLILRPLSRRTGPR